MDDNVENDFPAENGDVKVLTAVCLNNKVLGVASYNELTNTIVAGAIGVSTEDTDFIFNNLKTMYSPTLFLIHPKVASNKSLLDLMLTGLDGSADFYRFKVLKSSQWNENTALATICNCLIIKTMQRSNHSGNIYQAVASSIDLEYPQVKQALGALLLFMQETVFNLDEGKIAVAALQHLHLQSYMRIDETSFKALQIFAEEFHPNVIKSKGRNKEGFSLFGLFDRTHSIPGRFKLKDWMSKPFCDKNLILSRQKGVAFAVRDSNQELIKNLNQSLKHIHDLPRLLLRVKKVESTYQDWCRIHSSVENGLKIVKVLLYFNQRPDLARDADDSTYIAELVQHVRVDVIELMLQWLDAAIDFAESASLGVLYIAEGYDEGLDKLRHVYDQLETYLVQAAHKVLDAVPLIQVINSWLILLIHRRTIHHRNKSNTNEMSFPLLRMCQWNTFPRWAT